MVTRPRGPYRQIPNAVIKPEQAEMVRAAYIAAKRQGWPLDRLITLNFAFTDCEPAAMPAAFEYIRDMAVRWYRHEGKMGRLPRDDRFAFVWSLEQEGDWPHAHWLVHLPARSVSRFKKMLERWTMRAAGVARTGYFDMRKFDANGPLYLTKGTAPQHFVGPPKWKRRAGGRGYFYSKRAGASANLRRLLPK